MVEKRMSFIEHLEELRRRLIICIFAVFIGACACYAFWKPILWLITKPLGGHKLYYGTVMEPFIGRFRIAAFAGVFAAFPIILYEFLAFVAPALRRKEKRFIYPILCLLIFFFICGVVFGYMYLLPVSVKWLIAQGEGLLNPILLFDKYVAFAALFLLACGVGFETPVVILFLVKLGVVSPQALRRQWRVAYIIILIVAAIITPDWSPITMAVMAIPMIVLYEISILLARLF